MIMMELTQIPNVELFIGNNIEVLEDILDKRSQEYLAVKNEKEIYDFGKNLNPEILRELTGEVIKDTKNFLELDDSHPAHFSMFHLPRDLKYGVKVALGAFTISTLAELIDGLTVDNLKTAGLIGLFFGAGTILTIQREQELEASK